MSFTEITHSQASRLPCRLLTCCECVRAWRVAGMMRSFDQYGNVMLEDTFERHVVGNVYADERVSSPPPIISCKSLALMHAYS